MQAMANMKSVERYGVEATDISGAPHVRPLTKHWPYLGPLAIFAIVGVFLGVGLTLNPREIPSPLIGKPVPQFPLGMSMQCTAVMRPGSVRRASSFTKKAYI